MEEERFALDNNDNVLDFEDKTDKYCLSQEDVCNLLNRQQKRIAELEQELAELKEKAIVPKFKVGQKIWYIDRYGIQKDTIISFTYFSIQNEILYKMEDEIIDYREEYIFATEQEAQAKLKEIQGNE